MRTRGFAIATTALCLFLVLSAAVANAQPAEVLKLTTCAPSISNAHTQLAPGLRVVRQSFKRGKCKSSIAIIGGTSGDIWGANYNNGLWHSTDDLRTWQLVWQGPAGSYVERALRTASRHVLIEVVDSKGGHRIMRSTTGRAARFTTTFVLPVGSYLHFSTSWGQYSPVGGKPGTIYVAEYGGLPNPVHLWASTNDGRSFGTVFSAPGTRTDSPDRARHFHGVFSDPVTHWLWVAIGDNPPFEPRVGYSKDGGRTFTWITHGAYPESRVVGLMFAKDAVYWATDVPERLGGLYRWDRSTGAISQVLSGLREPFFDARQSRGWFVQFSQISTKQGDGYLGDEHVHVILGNGSDWREVTTPWTRKPEHQDGKIAPLGVTWPNRSGCFWLSLPNPSQSDGIANIKLCLGKS